MDERVVLVPANSVILNDPSTQKLHTYQNGDVLIRTAAAVSEEGGSAETPVNQGVQLEGVQDTDLQGAREQLSSVKRTKILQLPTDKVPSVKGPGSILAYVELIGPVDAQWLQELTKLGVQPLHYQPQNSYLCQGTVAAFQEASKQYFVLYVTPLTEVMKPRLETMSEAGTDVLIVIQGTQDQTSAIITSLGALPGVEILQQQQPEQVGSYLRIRARITLDGQNALLKDPRVRAIDPYQEATPEDEVAGLIVAGQYDARGKPNGAYLHWLENHGINGQGVTIGIVDNGVDAAHPAFSGRITDLGNGKKSWHGTGVAGHAAGNYLQEKDGNQFIYGLGMACAAELLIQDNSDTATSLCKQTVTEKGPSGISGSVQNNSWGKGTQDPMDYRSEEHTYDQLARNADPTSKDPKPLMICFSSGNSGKAGLTRPKSAKNVIITGNSKNFRPDVGKNESDNINDVYEGSHPSSWGNCADKRIRPHIVAPGEWTSSANYDSHQGEQEYISPELSYVGGSSGASPKVAGACALLIQWWRNHNAGRDPSPAMLRALIVNGAEPVLTGGPIPNMRQGWGRLSLENILTEDVPHMYVDQTLMLTQLGEKKEWIIRVSDPKKSAKVTLSWTDPPGPIGSGTEQVDAIVNKLTLSAEVNGVLYRGGWRQEHFQNGWSVADGSPDPDRVDNLQNVYLPAGIVTGTIKVTVKALNITTNCLSGEIDTPRQDFALAITNGQLDTDSTPSDVFVAVDKGAKGDPKPNSTDDFWKNSPNSSDTHALSADWWQATDAAVKGTSTDPNPSSNGSSDEDNWWSQTNVQWSKPETEKKSDSQPLTQDAEFVKGLKAGFDLLTASGGHQLVLGSAGPVGEVGGNHDSSNLVRVSAETERESDHAQTVNATEMELTQALAALMTSWDSFGTTESSNQVARRRTAVLVVGSGTRVSSEDIDAMRRITFWGELYLVSADPAILSFLAQRIHRRNGIRFRLATNAAELAQLVRDTLAEASGGQIVGVTTEAKTTPEGLISRHLFYVVEADTHLTFRIHYNGDAPVKGIKLQRPGQDAFLLDPHNSGDIRFMQRPEVMQIDIDATANAQPWSGQWILELMQPPTDSGNVAAVTAWTCGGPHLVLRPQTVPMSEAERDSKDVLVALSGDLDVTFNHSIIPPPRIAASQPVTGEEDERDIVMSVQASRLDREGIGAEGSDGSKAAAEVSRESAHSASLSEWITVPHIATGATVLDIPAQTYGTDGHGIHFARMIRTNLIQLEPRSSWRQHLLQQEKVIIITSAHITEMQYEGKKVIGLRLSKNNKQRSIIVSSLTLSEELLHFDLDKLKVNNFHFSVSGNELVGITRLLDG